MKQTMSPPKIFTHRIGSVTFPNYFSAPPKTMLKYCIFFHYMFSLAMLVKLTPYILKQFNISIVPVEELEVPDPLTWELVWLPSVLSSTLALHSMRKNSYVLMRYYMTGIVLLGFLPLLNGILEWLPEVIMIYPVDCSGTDLYSSLRMYIRFPSTLGTSYYVIGGSVATTWTRRFNTEKCLPFRTLFVLLRKYIYTDTGCVLDIRRIFKRIFFEPNDRRRSHKHMSVIISFSKIKCYK
ncbi:uncharacterized protein [Euwallacea fornicatus]|uniref:uncharacterized protein isoform X2 n=1 Tax=Euwallacea fornicatus TaxID=995702 RepID=UPI00338EFB3E